MLMDRRQFRITMLDFILRTVLCKVFYGFFLKRVWIIWIAMAIAPVFYYLSRFSFRGEGRQKHDLTNCLI
jgi:hypothetical protein